MGAVQIGNHDVEGECTKMLPEFFQVATLVRADTLETGDEAARQQENVGFVGAPDYCQPNLLA